MGHPMDVESAMDVSIAEKGTPASSVVESTPHSKPSLSLSTKPLSQGMVVTFKDISYTVASHHNKKEQVSLLKGVSGFLRPGEMSALMGPSGSGKTTLLDVLASRKTVGRVAGEIKFSGTAPTRQFLRRFTGYVEQFDTLLGILTVQEMLMYTSELKRPIEESLEEKKAAVDELIEQLALTSCRNVKIGNWQSRGISGGQAKRVNIGLALVANPRVLFLDEPTSGLDSYTGAEVIQVVRGLAVSKGITVVASIHSPTAECFNLFDRLLLLQRGRQIYFGPNGKTAIDYFHNQCPWAPQPRVGQNDAEWIVSITTQAEGQGRAEEFAKAYEVSELKRLADSEITLELQQNSTLSPQDQKDMKVKRDTVTPFWWGLRTLLKYRTSKNYTSPDFYGARLGDKVIFSFIVFTLYWKTGSDLSTVNVPNITALCFMWTILAGYGATAYTPTLVIDRPLFVRERNDGLYRVITYLCAKMVEELALAFVASIVFSCLVFYTLQMQGSWALFWLVYFCSLAIGIVLAYFISAISPTLDVANAALPAYVTSLLFFTGMLLRWDDIPAYWRWFGYIDFLRYSWGALMVNQFEGDRNVPVFDGIPVLNYYSLDGVNKWGWLGIEFCFFLFFFLCAYLALAFVRHVKR